MVPINNVCRKCLLTMAIICLSSIALIVKFLSMPAHLYLEEPSTIYNEDNHTDLYHAFYKGKKHAIGEKPSFVNLSSAYYLNNLSTSLPTDVIEQVKRFAFFIGNSRSGHSIVGSFLDAHPHMVVAHEFMLFKKLMNPNFTELALNKEYLFNALYESSIQDVVSGWRNESSDVKNYTLSVNSQWLGKYDRYISVIGDKSGGMTSRAYSMSPEYFTAMYQELKKTLNIPIRVIHCVRNPYDMVSTNALYEKGRRLKSKTFVASFKSYMSNLQNEEFVKAKFDEQNLLKRAIIILRTQMRAAMNITNLVGEENVLIVHNVDLVNDPNSTLTKMCDFLEVKCSPEYLRSCSEKVFKSTYKSRDLVMWPESFKDVMDSLIDKYTIFQRYSFSSE